MYESKVGFHLAFHLKAELYPLKCQSQYEKLHLLRQEEAEETYTIRIPL